MKDINNMMENVEQTIESLDKTITGDMDLLDLKLEEEETHDDDKNVIKCGSQTDPNALAFFMAREFETKGDCLIIQTIGAAALSKAILAIVRLKSIVAPYIDGSTLVMRPSVRKLQLPNGEERTTIRIRLFPVPDRYVV